MYLHKIKLACLVLCTICATFLFFDTAFAATASISTTGTVSIDVSSSGNSANIGSDMLTVNTTCSTGYTVSISSSINDTTLYKDGDSTSNSKITPTNGTLSSPLPIIGDDGNGTSYLGTWGYSMTNSAVTGTFTGLNSTSTIIKQSTTASATGGDQFPVYYGVSVTPSLEPGNYTMAKDSSNNPGTIVYQLTMPVECQTYTIKYDGNNNDPGTTMSVVNDNLKPNDSTTLMPSNYKRAGYGFAGWNTKADGTGTDFGPMEDVVLSTSDAKGNALINAADTNKEITLYAKWIQSAGNIQDWAGCNAMTAGSVTALTDTRDNDTYAIAKLADGNCWMIENLRLGGNAPVNLTTSDSALSANLTLPASVDTFTTSNWNNIEMNAKNTLQPQTDMSSANSEVYSYGNYYSWAAAIGDTTNYTTNNQSASTSICPKGWHLPRGGDKNNENNNEFWNLVVNGINNGINPANYSSSTYPYYAGASEGVDISKLARTYPNNFLYPGYLAGSTFFVRGSSSRTWSSVASAANNAYDLIIESSLVFPGTDHVGKYTGRSVRCVADEKPQPLNCPAGNICYSANATGVETRMVNQAAADDSEVALWAPNFKRDGYGFAGWSTEMENHDFGPKYGPNETIYTGDLSGGGIPLYAMWIPSAGNLQGWTGCGSLATGAVTALTDTRDNQTYAVAKLADGNCWMIENLRLGTVSNISSSNTNNPASSFTSLPAHSTTNWCQSSNVSCINEVHLNAENTLSPVTSLSTVSQATQSYGNYYTWAAATAGTGLYSMSKGNNATGSICPAGWFLPTVSPNDSSDYTNLSTSLGQGASNISDPTAFSAYPNNFLVYAGWAQQNGATRGYNARYASATTGSTDGFDAYNLFLSPTSGNMNTPTSKYLGYLVRCVAIDYSGF